MFRVFSIFFTFCFISENAFAASHAEPALGGRSDLELYLSLGVLVFGLIILGLQMTIMLKMKKGWEQNSTRITGLTLVIISGLFLVTAGYSQDQIAPMVGLLGTIAGYLLGQSENK